jgi:hypothetical protein
LLLSDPLPIARAGPGGLRGGSAIQIHFRDDDKLDPTLLLLPADGKQSKAKQARRVLGFYHAFLAITPKRVFH